MTNPYDQIRADADAAQAANQALAADDAAQKQQVAADAAQLAVDQALIAKLEAEINPTPPPPSGTVFSIDVPLVTPAIRAQFGGALPHVRVFSPTTVPTWPAILAHGVTAADHVNVSWKTRDPAGFRALLDGIPPDWTELDATFEHEPEDNAKASGNPAAYIANYLAAYIEMDAIRRAHPNGHKVKLVKIMMRYQEVTARQPGVTYREFHGGQMFVDAFGWDCYDPTGLMPSQELLGGLVACSKEIGVPPCAPELGVALSPSDPGGGRRDALIASHIAYAKANGLLWVNWWDQAQWLLSLSPAGLSTWRTAMTG